VSARTNVLERVRNAQRTGRLPREHGVLRPADDRAARRSPQDEFDLQAQFLRELQALGVETRTVTTVDDVRAAVSELIDGQRVFSWNAEHLPYDVGELFTPWATGSSPRDEQASADVGLTGCHAAIAETGSIVVLSGPGTPRSASLLPPVHVCLVRRTDLLATMGEFFATRAQDIAAASCCTFISGPSRTADIELQLTLGVHGPGRVVVIVGP
jgi:L-lactate dehydrogenase complex protein LldG